MLRLAPTVWKITGVEDHVSVQTTYEQAILRRPTSRVGRTSCTSFQREANFPIPDLIVFKNHFSLCLSSFYTVTDKARDRSVILHIFGFINCTLLYFMLLFLIPWVCSMTVSVMDFIICWYFVAAAWVRSLKCKVSE